MFVNDPIADTLTRMRNAILADHDKVKIPHSKMKESIIKIMKNEGLIKECKVVAPSNGKKFILVQLKYYSKNRNSVIRGMKRISKPGRRVYANIDKMPRVLRGLGMAIVSTSLGVMTDKDCRSNKVGGEVLCYIW